MLSVLLSRCKNQNQVLSRCHAVTLSRGRRVDWCCISAKSILMGLLMVFSCFFIIFINPLESAVTCTPGRAVK